MKSFRAFITEEKDNKNPHHLSAQAHNASKKAWASDIGKGHKRAAEAHYEAHLAHALEADKMAKGSSIGKKDEYYLMHHHQSEAHKYFYGVHRDEQDED